MFVFLYSLDSDESRSITEVAKLYSQQGGKTISSGYYSCNYNFSNSTIQCDQLNNTHQDVWKTLHVLLDNLSTKVSTSDFLKKDRDNVIEFLFLFLFLFLFRLGLSNKNNLNNGAWLSKIRNDVNYSHSMGAWYPYVNSSGDHLKMFRILNGWRNPPFLEDFSGDNDNVLFIKTVFPLSRFVRNLLRICIRLMAIHF